MGVLFSPHIRDIVARRQASVRHLGGRDGLPQRIPHEGRKFSEQMRRCIQCQGRILQFEAFQEEADDLLLPVACGARVMMCILTNQRWCSHRAFGCKTRRIAFVTATIWSRLPRWAFLAKYGAA